jgi:hypothetical protein
MVFKVIDGEYRKSLYERRQSLELQELEFI